MDTLYTRHPAPDSVILQTTSKMRNKRPMIASSYLAWVITRALQTLHARLTWHKMKIELDMAGCWAKRKGLTHIKIINKISLSSLVIYIQCWMLQWHYLLDRCSGNAYYLHIGKHYVSSDLFWSACFLFSNQFLYHYNDVIMSMMASQITSLTMVNSIVYSGADQRKHQSSTSLAFVRQFTGDRWPRKMFPFDDVIMVPLNI